MALAGVLGRDESLKHEAREGAKKMGAIALLARIIVGTVNGHGACGGGRDVWHVTSTTISWHRLSTTLPLLPPVCNHLDLVASSAQALKLKLEGPSRIEFLNWYRRLHNWLSRRATPKATPLPSRLPLFKNARPYVGPLFAPNDVFFWLNFALYCTTASMSLIPITYFNNMNEKKKIAAHIVEVYVGKWNSVFPNSEYEGERWLRSK
jgi:hypothetical protein